MKTLSSLQICAALWSGSLAINSTASSNFIQNKTSIQMSSLSHSLSLPTPSASSIRPHEVSNSSSAISFPTLTTISASTSHKNRSSSSIISANSSINTVPDSCQQQLVSWSSSVDKILHPYLTVTTNSITYLARAGNLTFGTAQVYTTIDGFARASGNFTATATVIEPTWSVSSTTTYTTMITPATASTPAKPSCVVNPASCDAMWSAYRSDFNISITSMAGLPPSAPNIWPVPTNSPRCSLTYTGCITPWVINTCSFSAGTVQVYYWPTSTGAQHSATPVTQVVEGITMTSPSIYMSFDWLVASSSSYVGGECVGKSPAYSLSLMQNTAFETTLGPVYTSQLFSFRPEELSTLELRHHVDQPFVYTISEDPLPFPDEAITALAGHDEAAYTSWIRALATVHYGRTQYIESALTVSDLAHPGPRAYYLAPRLNHSLPFGCAVSGPHSQCNTIFEEEHRAWFSIPSRIRALNPQWSTCNPAIYGVYDPPTALTGVNDGNIMTPTTAPSITTPATPAPTMAMPTVEPTPLTQTIPATVPGPGRNVATMRVNGPDPISRSVLPAGPAADATVNFVPGNTRGMNLDNTRDSALNDLRQTPPGASHEQSDAPVHAATPPETIAFSPAVAAQPSATNALQALTQHEIVNTAAVPTVAVFTAGDSKITATRASNGVVLEGQTLQIGATTVLNGLQVSIASSAIVVQSPQAAATSIASKTQAVASTSTPISMPTLDNSAGFPGLVSISNGITYTFSISNGITYTFSIPNSLTSGNGKTLAAHQPPISTAIAPSASAINSIADHTTSSNASRMLTCGVRLMAAISSVVAAIIIAL